MTLRCRSVAATALAVLCADACSNSTGLPPAIFSNVVDTVSLFALRGTSIQLPSAYALSDTARVRIDQSLALDFAFDYDSVTHTASLFSTGALKLGSGSGLQRTTTAFGTITLAPTSGYQYDSALVVDTGNVLYVASRPLTCVFGAVVPLYAKLHVLELDTIARRLDFEILVDQNCGYRGLAPGVPKQ